MKTYTARVVQGSDTFMVMKAAVCWEDAKAEIMKEHGCGAGQIVKRGVIDGE